MTFAFIPLQGVLSVGGEDASVVCSHFGSKIFICISHYQKFGTLVSSCTDTKHVAGSHGLMHVKSRHFTLHCRAQASL